MSVTRQLFVVFVLAALMVGGWTYFGPLLGMKEEAGGQSGSKKGRDTSVVVSDIKFVKERLRTEAVGTARAYQSARLHPGADGRVTATALDADAQVVKGQVLLELDRKAETLAVDLARVRLAAAQRVAERLEKLRKSGKGPGGTRRPFRSGAV